MKKILILIAVAVYIVSCRGPEGPQGYGTNWKIIDLVVSSNDWVEKTDQAGLNRYYTSHFSMPEITSNVYKDGTVLTYLVTDNVQQNLPYVRHYENSNGNLWTQTVDYDFSVGNMNVYVTNSDFIKEQPGTMHFRVVLMW